LAAQRRKRDLRRFTQVSNDLPDNPKIEAFDQRDKHTIMAVAVSAWIVSNDSAADGEIVPRTALRKADAVGLSVDLDGEQVSVTDAMVAVGFWHRPGHTCQRCPQPRAGRVQLHDISLHQPSKADREELIEKKRRAGRASAKKRWGTPDEQEELPLGVAAGQDPAVTGVKTAATTGATTGGKADAMARATEQLGAEVQVPARQARPASRRKTKMREGWPLTEEMRLWAKEKIPDVDVGPQHERFVLHYVGKGTPVEDWGALWRSWMLDEQAKAKNRRGGRAPYRSPAGGAAELEDDWAPARRETA
jgi:hypothetical protein